MDERPRSLPRRAGLVTSADPPSAQEEDRQAEAELDDLLRWPADERLVEAALADLQLEDIARENRFPGQKHLGLRWGVVEDALIDYGYQRMAALLWTGYIFQRCKEHGLRLQPQPIPPDEQEDLAQDTVVAALRKFKKDLAGGGGWDPEGGANIRTFFAKGVLYEFANIWRKRLRANPISSDTTFDDLANLPALDPGPYEMCAQRDDIRRGLADITSVRTRAALVLTVDGYDQEEIADILGVTARAVEGYLRRQRQRTRQTLGDGEG